MASERHGRSLLTLLLATCEVTLDNARRDRVELSQEFLAELEGFVQRTRAELEALGDE
jgi:hypothetical protein